MTAYVPTILVQVLRAFINPGGYISGRSATYEQGIGARIRKISVLSAVYSIGLILYALPLTYAGIGLGTGGSDPPARLLSVAAALRMDPTSLWVFLKSLAANTAFLITGSIAIFCVFHAAVFVLRTSEGFLQSVHTIVYASGMYLAAAYSFVWALSINESVRVADQLILAVQAAFINAVIELTGTGVTLPGGNTPMPDTATMTTTGSVLLVGLVLSILYLLYSLYIAVRTNHHGSRFQAFGTVVVVLSTPVLYVLASIVSVILQTP